MWMREEAIGLQECFELAHHVMEAYTASELEGRDSTVELYLLNFWTKELSYRDICDRISHCVLALSNYKTWSSAKHELDEKQLELFNYLLAWFTKTRLFPEKATEESWEISDLRKIVHPLAQAAVDNRSVLHQVPKDFVKQAAALHGANKLREFMEVQLVQKADLFLKFAAWFDQSQRATTADSARVPKVAIEKL
jgi:hypothetical protein